MMNSETLSCYIIFCALLFSSCQDELSMNNPGNNPVTIPQPILYDWTLQNAETYVDLTDVHFIDNMTGWIVGEDNTVLSTTMGGNTWPQAPVSTFDGNFRSVHLIDENKGWISGDMNGKTIDGNIYISTSGGSYPDPQKSLMYPLNTIFCLDEKLVWTGGEKGQLLYTTDGGKTWLESVTKPDFSINSIQFLDKNTGFAAGSKGNIITSKDGGISWDSIFVIPESDLLSIHFIDSATGWACGSKNTILKYNGEEEGAKWSLQPRIENEPVGITWKDIFFLDENYGWIVGDGGTVYRTENGGNSWINESTGLFDDLNAIHMVEYDKGWIVGEEGLILTYTPLM